MRKKNKFKAPENSKIVTSNDNDKLGDKFLALKSELQIGSSTIVQSGPLPPAEQFKVYEEVYPGAADRILKMLEEQAVHRREVDKKYSYHNVIYVYIILFTRLLFGIMLLLFVITLFIRII